MLYTEDTAGCFLDSLPYQHFLENSSNPPVTTIITAAINPHHGIIKTISIPHPVEHNISPNIFFGTTPPKHNFRDISPTP